MNDRLQESVVGTDAPSVSLVDLKKSHHFIVGVGGVSDFSARLGRNRVLKIVQNVPLELLVVRRPFRFELLEN